MAGRGGPVITGVQSAVLLWGEQAHSTEINVVSVRMVSDFIENEISILLEER